MGRRDRERIARIIAGQETPRAKLAMERVKNTAVHSLQRFSTSNQIKFLADSMHQGRLPASQLRDALKSNARKEMHKGAEKLAKKKKEVTVDKLLEEYRKDKEFQKLADEVGLDEAFFIRLAELECDKWKVPVK